MTNRFSLFDCLSLLALFLFSLVSSPAASFAQDINGTWHFDYGYDMTFSGSGGSFTGSGEGGSYSWVITGGVVSGNSVTWHESYNEINYTVERTGTISGDTMSGTATTSYGQNLDWSATRIASGPTPTPTAVPGNKRATAMQLFCDRVGVNLETASCTVSLADAGPPPRTAPTGIVNLIAMGGFVPGNGECAPVQSQYSPGIGSCKAEFAVPFGFPIGAPFPIEARYPGDSNFEASSSAHALIQAGCVGTPEKPCSGGVGATFADIPAIIKNIMSVALHCGSTGSPLAALAPNAAASSDSCSIDSSVGLKFGELLSDLGLDQDLAGEIGAALGSENLGNSSALQALRDMMKDVGKGIAPLGSLENPNELDQLFRIYLKRQSRKNKRALARRTDDPSIDVGVYSNAATTKKLYTEVVGATSVKIKAGKVKKVRIKLNAVGRKFISALRKAGVPSVKIVFTLKSQRIGSVPKGAKRRVSTAHTIDAAL